MLQVLVAGLQPAAPQSSGTYVPLTHLLRMLEPATHAFAVHPIVTDGLSGVLDELSLSSSQPTNANVNAMERSARYFFIVDFLVELVVSG